MGLELTAVNGLPVVEKITHLSHWIQLPSDVLVHAIAMAFSSGTGIICKYQRDVDLIVPVLLDDRTETWEAEPNLPIFGTCRENAYWSKEQEEKVLTWSYRSELIE